MEVTVIHHLLLGKIDHECTETCINLTGTECLKTERVKTYNHIPATVLEIIPKVVAQTCKGDACRDCVSMSQK